MYSSVASRGHCTSEGGSTTEHMEAIHNFRDFGGYKIANGTHLKKGLLYRSGDLSQATDADLEYLSALGIKTIYDLRSDEERARQPDRIPAAKPFTFLNIPMRPIVDYHGRSLRRLFSLMFGRERRMDYVAESYKAYREYATSYLPQLKALFQRISHPENLPVLIHCSAGKDRTGVVSSLIQLVLGVSVETAMDDYLKTNGLLDAYTEQIYRKLSKLAYFGVPWKMYTPLFDARSEYLNAALAQVKEEFGAIDEWFRRGLGFSEKEKKAFLTIFDDASG
jgi:protein-tyrosine phosphatase